MLQPREVELKSETQSIVFLSKKTVDDHEGPPCHKPMILRGDEMKKGTLRGPTSAGDKTGASLLLVEPEQHDDLEREK